MGPGAEAPAEIGFRAVGSIPALWDRFPRCEIDSRAGLRAGAEAARGSSGWGPLAGRRRWRVVSGAARGGATHCSRSIRPRAWRVLACAGATGSARAHKDASQQGSTLFSSSETAFQTINLGFSDSANRKACSRCAFISLSCMQ